MYATINSDLTQNHKILLVENRPLHLVLYKHWLRKLNYTVHTATDGFDALAQIQHDRDFELILVDFEIGPLMSGIELTKYIRILENQIGKRIVIIGYSSSMSIENCIEAGLDDLLIKPMNKLILKAILGYWRRYIWGFNAFPHALDESKVTSSPRSTGQSKAFFHLISSDV